jgi:hypothetical protein
MPMVGERNEVLDLNCLIEGFEAINHTDSEKELVTLISQICASILPCDGGGVGLYSTNGRQAQAEITYIRRAYPVVSFEKKSA